MHPTRSFLGCSGVCANCRCFDYLWVGAGLPSLCDECDTRRRVRDAYTADPALAARVYAAPDADAALRLLGVDPRPPS